jgi:hypothetical protein
VTRGEILRERGQALLVALALLVDLLACLVLSIVLLLWAVATGQEGAPPTPFETLSARAGRARLNGKFWARITVPVVDLLFRWQAHAVALPDGRTFTHPSHCLRAFIKLRTGGYLPREYHGPLPPSIEACFAHQPNPR